MGTGWESDGIVDSGFLESLVQQAALLLGATGGAFYLCESSHDRDGVPRLAAIHHAQESDWDAEMVRRVCAAQVASIQNRADGAALVAVPCAGHDSTQGTERPQVRGVLVVVDDLAGRVFDQQDAGLLQPLAGIAAAGLHQAERLARTTAQFRALHAIDIALSSSLQLERVLNLILEKAVELVGAEHGSLRLLDSETGELVLKSYWGEGWTPEIRAYTFQLGQGITGWVAQNREPYLCHDAQRDPRNVVLFEEMNSSVAVPLLTGPGGERDALLGVLLLESKRARAFDQHGVELLEALAQEAVIAIQNATQHRELQLMYRAWQDEQERRLAAEKWTVMGQAATALAHRINNLIGIVPASAGEVRRAIGALKMPQSERQWVESNLDRIERNSQFVLKLAEALFRPFQEMGPSARCDVNLLLNEALQAAGLPARCRVVRDYGHDLPFVESNLLLADTFLELITNARKAMECRDGEGDTPLLRLRTWLEPDEAGSWVVIEISDTGRGISEEQMVHLWDMFQPSSDGLGFGLWWVRTFIERQGGTIACDTWPGAGTSFTVRLPASSGEGRPK